MYKKILTTKRPKRAELPEKWYLVDANGKTLGRLASAIAKILIGKDAVTYDPAVMTATKIVVVNTATMKITGKKLTQKKYYRHSGYMGGLKTTAMGDMMQKNPALVLRKAVSGMLPKNRLRKNRLDNLKAFADDNHPHMAQKPVKLEL